MADPHIIILEGHYQGKNLYVQNPFAPGGIGFCVYDVRVNDLVCGDDFLSSAFEIDFRPFGLQKGDTVTVKIFHKDGCLPLVMNPEAIKPRSS